MISTLFRALRKGASVQNPTRLKWAGVAVALAIIALEIAKSYGVLADVSEATIIELVMAGLVLYSQIASTDKIGVLPRPKPKIIDALSDEEITELMRGVNDMGKRLRTDRLQADTDAPETRDSNGFPRGPFFRDS